MAVPVHACATEITGIDDHGNPAVFVAVNPGDFHQIISRTSVRCPVTAAAAAMPGLTRWVRPL